MTFNIFSRKSGIRFAVLASVAALGAGVSTNGYAASADGTANATVVTPIAITADVALEFGQFSTSAAGQTVIVGTDGSASGTALRSTATTTTAAQFTVTGQGSLTYALTMPTTDTVTTGAGGATEIMNLSDFTVVGDGTALTGAAPSYVGTLTSGQQILNVGATLTTVASQTAGFYTGTFPLTVEYN